MKNPVFQILMNMETGNFGSVQKTMLLVVSR